MSSVFGPFITTEGVLIGVCRGVVDETWDVWLSLDLRNTTVFPAIREKIQAVQAAERGKFDKGHRIIDEFPVGSHVAIKNVHRKGKTEPRYDGPFTVRGKSEGGSYILEDDTGALLQRDIPPSHLKLLSQDIVVKADNVYELLSVVDHKGSNGNYKYRVTAGNSEFHELSGTLKSCVVSCWYEVS